MHRFVELREPQKSLSNQSVWGLAEASAELRLQSLRDARVYSESLFRLKEEYLKKLHALIGKDKLPKYLKLHNKRLAEMEKARRNLPPTEKGLEKLHKLRQRSVQKSKELIDGSGVDVRELRNLQQAYARSAAALDRKIISKGEGPHPGPGEVEYKKNQTYTPPYLGEDSECFSDRSRGTVTSRNWTDRLTGEVGAETTIRLRDADDSDFIFAACRPRMRIVYTMDRPGPLTVRVQLETNNDQVQGSYEDECGYSRMDFRQRLRVYAQRTWPHASSRIYGELPGGSYSHHDRLGPMGMLAWVTEFSDPGDMSTISLVIPPRPGAVPGEMMGIDVGIETFNYCWVNDVTIYGLMRNSYFIREIRLLS
jgi:hypothetical protein